jgi:hypothetical protein
MSGNEESQQGGLGKREVASACRGGSSKGGIVNSTAPPRLWSGMESHGVYDGRTWSRDVSIRLT